jgi:uracil-DNA glycosylase family 4
MTQGISLTHRLTQTLYDPNTEDFTAAAYPFIPLTEPGMPPAGPDFIAHAVALGDEIDEASAKKKKAVPVGTHLTNLYRNALYRPDFHLPISHKSSKDLIPVPFLPGHRWGKRGAAVEMYGPWRKAKVMIVGKLPGYYEMESLNATAGPAMNMMADIFEECGISPEAYEDWYVTFACKFAPPMEITAVPAAWIKNCAILLEQEIRIVQPEFILCLGNEATKAVMRTTGAITGLAGRILDVSSVDTDGNPRTMKALSVMHPAFVVRKPEVTEDFVGQIRRFKALIHDEILDEEAVDHADVYTEAALAEIVDEMVSDPDPNANIIAIDCEWHGEYPTEEGAYLRTVQISNKDKWARTIVLRHQGGAEAFQPNLDAARRQLTRLLKSTPERNVRVGGHFFRADLPWLFDFGVDVRPEYAPAEDPDDRTHGGWDTSLMYHAVNECARYGLDECSMRFTAAPTYWEPLDHWKKKYRSDNKLKASEVGGYGECPAHILHPYASYDVDVTRRIMMRFYGTNGKDGLIARSSTGHDCWLPYWTAHNSSLAFLEMEMTGLEIDRNRADELTTLFMNTQERLLAEIREELQWPAFNPKSQPQLAIALFGRDFADRYTNSPPIPEDAQTLDLRPVKTTGKRPVLWNEMSYRGINPETATPSTDKESLGILGHMNSTAAKIRDYKFISQVLQSVLRKPAETEDGEYELDENGNYTYEKGLVGCVHSDGKVRTHMFQTKETGRASSSRPPLQNLSSRREDDYKRILGKDKYQHPVRSILRVPKGCIGIETDLTGAELAVLAWLSQDKNMIEHVRRNLLPEDHPDHYDIHSQQAVKTFRLSGVTPTKQGMVDAGVKGLRVAAKNVNFGIPYGRGSEALARQCKEEGHDVTADQCQAMIDAYFQSYPGTKTFLAECRMRSQDPGWLVGPYGRFRRFMPTKDRAVRGEQERQAQNFPIQGGVADAVSIALYNFYKYREEHSDIDYKIALQIHDAIVLIVPLEHAERLYKEVIPACMIDGVPFWPHRLDGTKIDVAEPYHFGMSRDVFFHWGENLKPEKSRGLGVDWFCDEKG